MTERSRLHPLTHMSHFIGKCSPPRCGGTTPRRNDTKMSVALAVLTPPDVGRRPHQGDGNATWAEVVTPILPGHGHDPSFVPRLARRDPDGLLPRTVGPAAAPGRTKAPARPVALPRSPPVICPECARLGAPESGDPREDELVRAFLSGWRSFLAREQLDLPAAAAPQHGTLRALPDVRGCLPRLRIVRPRGDLCPTFRSEVFRAVLRARERRLISAWPAAPSN
jgi:hypothetical protein